MQDTAIAMTEIPFTAIDHVQLAMPAGAEEAARHFYVDVLHMIEVPKPPALAKRGGCWFQSGTAQVHLGVEDNFQPARKAHPGLRCSNYITFVAHLRDAGVEVNEPADIPDVRRCHIHDPFGNRIELIES
jgi:catechol 2,3-dioxygenase-like lactoylglutathione lyase family enzyme